MSLPQKRHNADVEAFSAVAICLIGFFMATFFSIGISALTKLLPRHLHTGTANADLE